MLPLVTTGKKSEVPKFGASGLRYFFLQTLLNSLIENLFLQRRFSENALFLSEEF